MPPPLLDVRDLRKAYNSTVALAGVSLHVDPGEVFGLLGPNGAGKSTLLAIVAGLLAADDGAVSVAGQRLHPGDREVRRLIGVVPQELALYHELTAAENLSFIGALYGMRGQDLRSRVVEILRALGLDDRADQRVGAFSGGMLRRLNLGAALVHRPRLLLLDEPTTGVDPQSRNRLFEEIRRLNAEGVTIVYTSHYMEEVQALCSRIGIIDHGRLAACDTLPNLLSRLPARIRWRAAPTTAALREQVAGIDGVVLGDVDASTMELQCAWLPPTLMQLLAALRQHHAELTLLETEEPNLEKVFLHLTGRALRDG